MACGKVKASILVENNTMALDKYICPKCDNILTDAVQTSCGHWLCHDCAEQLFCKKEGTPYCPRLDCGEELSTEEGRPFFPDRFVRKEISHKLRDLSGHLGNCVHEKKECKYCKETFMPSEYQSHVECCPEAIVTCPFKEYGCKAEIPKREFFAHLTQCFPRHAMIVFTTMSALAGGNNPVLAESVKISPSLTRSFAAHDLDDASGMGREGGMGNDRLMSLVMSKVQAELSKKDSMIRTLQDKVAHLESTMSSKSENEDRDFRLSLMENSNFDGSMVWKIPQFSQRIDDAKIGKYTSIFSLPFYSCRSGYKMCLRLYILGNGIGKGTHMSLFFVVMKGEFDNILHWPFKPTVTFKLINQCGGRDIMDIFQPDPLSSSFQKPKSDMNVASGCPRFVSIDEMKEGYIVDDTIFIEVKVDTATMRHP